MEPVNRLRRGWDNAPHWPSISTAPHHSRAPDQEMAQPSTVTNLEERLPMGYPVHYTSALKRTETLNPLKRVSCIRRRIDAAGCGGLAGMAARWETLTG